MNKITNHIKKNGPLYLMSLPGVATFLIFSYFPMFGIILAFKKFNYSTGIFKSPWVNFDNFKFLFQGDIAFRITRNTVLYNLFFIAIDLILAIILAIILNEIKNRTASKVYQTVMIMPYFLSWVVVAFIVKAFLDFDNGYLNNTAAALGMEKTLWYSKVDSWPFILSLAHIWKTVGYESIIYLAAITGISNEYYEAAVLDGASKFKQAIYITIPSIKPMIIILTVMALGRVFSSDFGLFFQVPMNNGQLYPVTQTIDVYVYNGLVTGANLGMSAAAGLYQSLVGFLLVIMSNIFIKKVDKDYALF